MQRLECSPGVKLPDTPLFHTTDWVAGRRVSQLWWSWRARSVHQSAEGDGFPTSCVPWAVWKISYCTPKRSVVLWSSRLACHFGVPFFTKLNISKPILEQVLRLYSVRLRATSAASGVIKVEIHRVLASCKPILLKWSCRDLYVTRAYTMEYRGSYALANIAAFFTLIAATNTAVLE